ncbi:M20/M25/M40 family metallo-hydrolase [Geodermatophilus sp. YIM 151500]|uniref:M20/M25/M40 family metallo-hydrolase n=1 Tax=Geodermatophilus sp. YIM 151500 TaxID=2984531 RepID=UPI0021E466B0|nr:M20/M25/M40 family metallo-hydrolase [Geodermatophilus sp. YIM 151500]MCV2489185.1 M20/M25/M40 family metallo-hydrolase [Geodermatophilus sp. YIM 151500]
MADLTGTAVFFDIGDTLASVALSGAGDRIELTVYPYVPGVLAELRDRGARLGVLSDPGPLPTQEVDRALASAGLGDRFDPALVRYGPKDGPGAFEQAAAAAAGAQRVLFVGEDPGERASALRAGLAVAPHPLLALPLLEEESPVRYVRVTVPPTAAGGDWRRALGDLRLLPLHVTGEGGTTVYAVVTASAAARLDDLGFWVDRLSAEDEPLTNDLYLLRDDRQVRSGFLSPEGNSAALLTAGTWARSVLASTDEGLFVAVPAGASVEDLHFSDARHGHNLKLVPMRTLLTTGAVAEDAVARSLVVERAEAVRLSPAEQQVLGPRVQREQLAGSVERYAGSAPDASDGAVIRSRHIHHPDNAAAVATLVADLEGIGGGRLSVRRHQFRHEGRVLENVEAELPGRELDGVVLVTAHLDSTAARRPGYRARVDPAPGADDDASGIAGVLAAVEAIGALDAALAPPRRTVRFVLFNAEEHGLVGSRAYASDVAALGTAVVAVFQMDMIGYDRLPGRTFEVHAGFTPAPEVEASSLGLARLVTELQPTVSPALRPAQVYPAGGEWDEAERRSDHSSFHEQGYPAVLASEDLFAGPGPGAPPAEMNPEYHLPTDATIDAGYAADIARVVTAAAWVAATR